MKKTILIAMLAMSTTAIAAPPYKDGKPLGGQEIAWIGKGQDAVKAKLKDPSSAQFRELYVNRGQGMPPMTCGEVNSKNSFGGFSGYQRFVSAGTAELTFLESEVSDFGSVWAQLCR